MNKILFLFLSITFPTIIFSCASPTKSVKQIEAAYFTGSNKKPIPFITGYVSFINGGLATYYDNDRRTGIEEFTNIQLPDSLISKMKELFNGKKKLKVYEERRKMEENEFFAGEYFYLKLTYDDNTIDSLCTIQPFLSTKFNEDYDSFVDFIYEKSNRRPIAPFKISSSFQTSLNSAYHNCDYLPEITSAPSFYK